MTSLDRNDTKRALVQLAGSGERYIIEYCSAWQDEQVVGTRILASLGPLHYRDLGLDEGPLEPSAALFDAIDQAANLTDEDADWLQAEDEAGRLHYPIGVR